MKTVTCELSSILPSSNDYCKGLNPSSSQSADVSSSSPGTEGVAKGITGRIPCDTSVVFPPHSLPVSFLSGLDKLEVSCWVHWEVFGLGDTFLDSLGEARDQIRSNEFGRDVMEVPFDIGNGMSFNLSRLGAGKYPFVLKSADITILFSHHPADGRFPNCRLEVGSMSCWNPGWKDAWEKFLSLLKFNGGTLIKHNIRRGDLAVDLLECDFAETGFIDSSRWISKGSKKIHTVEEDYVPSYKSFGKGAMMLRCYDKTMELKNDSVKSDFFNAQWAEHLGFVPEHVTRVENQLCRRVLKDLGIHTVDDLEQNLNSIWLYCVGGEGQNGWSRFCSSIIPIHARRSKNHDSYSVDPLWEYIRSARFDSAPPVKLVRAPKPKPHFDFALARKRMASALLTVCAAWGIASHQFDLQDRRAFNFVHDSLQEARLYPEDYLRKYDVKQNTYYQFGECSELDSEYVTPTIHYQAVSGYGV